ncbi:MAG: squalene synthase HpnC [Phycisphaerae bacterium]|nr:squalene synthase HpnC [Phycisphaerae bacterium]
MSQARILEDLVRFGPDVPDEATEMSVEDARVLARKLTRSHRENFSVLTRLVPEDVQDDFAAVYAFCRTADDLGDEIGDSDRALALLDWWRCEIDRAWAGEPRHWVFRALGPTIRRFDLPPEPFLDLVSAFEQDQSVTRYETWDQLIDYCRRSADPVGRLVLALLEEPITEEIARGSDAICTALQLTNHWQDLQRDLLDRDRIYLPREMNDIDDFERRFRESATQGWAVDETFLQESRELVRKCVDRTWSLFEAGSDLPDKLGPRAAPVVETLASGGVAVLRLVEDWDCETVLHRPTLSPFAKLSIVGQAWWRTRVSRRSVSSRPVGDAGPGVKP